MVVEGGIADRGQTVCLVTLTSHPSPLCKHVMPFLLRKHRTSSPWARQPQACICCVFPPCGRYGLTLSCAVNCPETPRLYICRLTSLIVPSFSLPTAHIPKSHSVLSPCLLLVLFSLPSGLIPVTTVSDWRVVMAASLCSVLSPRTKYLTECNSEKGLFQLTV